MKSHEIDRTDRIILSELQKDAQRPVAELAAQAGLSASSCHRRVKLLEEAGVIRSYSANLDRTALGLANEFFVEVSLSAQTEEAFEKFEPAVQRMPGILDCPLMSGQFDYLLRVAAADLPGTIVAVLSALALVAAALWLQHCCKSPSEPGEDAVGEGSPRRA